MSIKDSGSHPFYLLLILLIKTKQHIRKQRHYFVNKGPYIPSYGFSSSHEQMWKLDHNEGWVPKSWCFWIVVLEKTLENLLDSKEIKPVNPKGNQHWLLIGRIDAEAEAPILWPPDVNSQLIEKDPDAGKDRKQDERVQEREAWSAAAMGWQRAGHDLVTEQQQRNRGRLLTTLT